jgi:hypothetical protein
MAKAIANRANILTSGEDEDALTPTDSGEKTLINFGNLITTGKLANGIFAGANHVLVQNFGLVETQGDGAAGIFVQGENAHIENRGSVITTGGMFDPTPEEPFSDDEFFSEGIFALGDRFHIANHGSVQVSGVGSSALVGFGADGLIINFGVVESSASPSVVVAAIGDRSQVINAGSVTSHGDGSSAVFVLGEDTSALNLGQIAVTGALGIGLTGGSTNTHLTNIGVIRITADESFGMVAVSDGPRLSNSGRIATEGDLAIGATLGVIPTLGFSLLAVDGQIVNRGVIETVGDGAAGVVMAGDGLHLTNSGRITSDGGAFGSATIGVLRAAGVVVSGDDALVENASKGVIESLDVASAAVEMNVLERDGLSNADASSTLKNFGLIEGAVAVLSGDGQETVINHGRIVGDVNLGAGDDEFVAGKGGILTGDLILDGGDDHVLIENGSGTTRIADFVTGESTDDDIDVSAFFSNLDDLKSESEQIGTDVIIALDHNDTLVLVGVELSTLNVDDFSFV